MGLPMMGCGMRMLWREEVSPNIQMDNDMRVYGLKAKKEGRGTIRFTNGAIYEGRFKEDRMEGQGTMKMNGNVCIRGEIRTDLDTEKQGVESDDEQLDWMIPIQFQSDMGHIHQKAGFTKRGE